MYYSTICAVKYTANNSTVICTNSTFVAFHAYVIKRKDDNKCKYNNLASRAVDGICDQRPHIADLR